MSQPETPISIQEPDATSALMELALADSEPSPWWRGSVCAGLYLVLALIWLPGFTSPVEMVTPGPEPEIIKVRIKPKPLDITQVTVQSLTRRRMPVPEQEDTVLQAPEIRQPDIALVMDQNMASEWGLDLDADVAPPDNETVFDETTLGLEPPIILSRAGANYPERASRIGLQGRVTLEVVLDRDGEIGEVKVIRGLGKGKFGFEEAAIAAVQKWTFLPSKLRGKPVSVRMLLNVEFILNH